MIARSRCTWKGVGLHLFLWLLIIIIALLSGCGTRKVSMGLDKSSTEKKEESKVELKQEEKSVVQESKEEADSSEVKNDVVTTETTKTYNSEGRLIEERSKTTIDKTTHKSSSKRKSFKSEEKWKILDIRTTTYKLEIITTKKKSKVIDADKTWVANVGGRSIILILGGLIVAAVFIYFLAKGKLNLRNVFKR